MKQSSVDVVGNEVPLTGEYGVWSYLGHGLVVESWHSSVPSFLVGFEPSSV